MKSASKDARGFVDGVINHLKHNDNKTKDVSSRVQSLLLKMSSAARREHQATVESTVKLRAPEIQAIARLLTRIAGHEVSLTCEVNTELIGGMRITMGDWVVDTSVRNELNDMAHMVNIS